MRDVLGHPQHCTKPGGFLLHGCTVSWHGADFNIGGAAMNKKTPIVQQSRLPVRLEQWRWYLDTQRLSPSFKPAAAGVEKGQTLNKCW